MLWFIYAFLVDSKCSLNVLEGFMACVLLPLRKPQPFKVSLSAFLHNSKSSLKVFEEYCMCCECLIPLKAR